MNQLILDLKAAMWYLNGYYIYRYFSTKIALFEADPIANQSALVSFQSDLTYFFAHTLFEADKKSTIVDLCSQMVALSSVGTLNVNVKDSLDNSNQSGVTIALQTTAGAAVSGQSDKITDASGNVQFTNVVAGSYRVNMSKTAYTTKNSANFTVTTNATTNRNETLVPQTGTISGTVTNGVLPISDVLVSVTGDGSATTDVNGVYSISDVRIGTKTVTATKTGYTDYSNNAVSVTNGATTTLDITMTVLP